METGTEALFADLGHFSVMSIRLSMCCVAYPALVSAYVGQASFLRENAHLVSDAFFSSIPGTRKFKLISWYSFYLNSCHNWLVITL